MTCDKICAAFRLFLQALKNKVNLKLMKVCASSRLEMSTNRCKHELDSPMLLLMVTEK